ncbi:MAG: hypothetical protein WD734_07130 [Dehalococcoidia bacterium]
MAERLFETDESFQAEMTELLNSDCHPHAFADALASRLPADQAEALRAEFAELPFWIGRSLTANWRLAREAGKRLELRSVPPRNLMAAARTRRVELSVAVDDDAVIVELSHVPARHAEWYARLPEPVAV